MSQRFVKGQKSRLSALTTGTDLYVGVHLDMPGAEWDISCFGLDAAGRLSDDRYLVFFNQPESPEGALRKLGPQQGDTDSFRVLLDKVPATIARLSFCAAIDSAGSSASTAAGLRSGYLRLVVDGAEVVRYPFAGGDFGTERAVMVADLYRKDGWRFGAVGQGFAGGLADLIRSFGGTVDQEPDEQPTAPAAPPRPAGQAAPPPAGSPSRAPQPPPPFGPPPGSAAPQPVPAAPPFGPPPGPAAAPPAPVAPQSAPAVPPPMPAVPPPMPAVPPPMPAVPPPGPAAPQPGPAAPQPMPATPQPAPAAGTRPGALSALAAFHQVDKPGERWVKQNPYLVRVTLGPDCHARRGSMVAYRGNVKFEYKGSGGLRSLFEGAMTGQQLRLMTCKGQGEVYLAEDAADVHLLHLAGQRLCLNASNVLAFDASLNTEIKRIESPAIPGGGMFHLEVGGHGTVVVMTRGTPVTLPVRGPTYADMNALVAWTAGMRVSASTQLRISREAWAGGPAEGIALQFMALGDHFVVVQPYEV